MTSTTTAVIGGSGFTGAELAELLLRHPSLRLTHVSSDTQAGTPVAAALPRVRTDLSFCRHDEVTGVDTAFLCLPDHSAAPIAGRLLAEGTRVVDLSPDFRLSATDYEEWYGSHPFPEMLPGVYGLTELHRDEVAAAQLVANPGCYPTAALLALTPLLPLGLQDVVIDAKSGASGAGKTPSEKTHFCTVDEDLLAYGIGGHRHYPEIAAGIGASGTTETEGWRAAGADGVTGADGKAASGAGADHADAAGPSLVFLPHVVPLQRGILETIYVSTRTLPSAVELRALFDEMYAGEHFVEVCEAPPRLRQVAGTNYCRLFATLDERSRRIVLVAAIDNLLKGAVGQALQNMNVMLGLPEQEGLL